MASTGCVSAFILKFSKFAISIIFAVLKFDQRNLHSPSLEKFIDGLATKLDEDAARYKGHDRLTVVLSVGAMRANTFYRFIFLRTTFNLCILKKGTNVLEIDVLLFYLD